MIQTNLIAISMHFLWSIQAALPFHAPIDLVAARKARPSDWGLVSACKTPTHGGWPLG
jgi:hypothetical protein